MQAVKPGSARFGFNFARVKMLALLLVLVVVLLQVGVAFAHAKLKTASILPDAVLTAAPANLSVTFTEETSPTQTKLQVLDASGKAVDKGDLKVSGDTATVSLGTLADGKYSVKFRSLTEDDGGIVDGEYSFSIAANGTAAAGTAASAKQAESRLPSAPGAGVGGAADSEGVNPSVLLALLVAVGTVAATSLVVISRRRKI